jgi:hypothetical protein
MEARILTKSSNLSGYPKEYLSNLLDQYSIIPIVASISKNTIEAIQPWSPSTGEPWDTEENALLWAATWIASNISNIDEPIINPFTVQSEDPNMIPNDSVPRSKTSK